MSAWSTLSILSLIMNRMIEFCLLKQPGKWLKIGWLLGGAQDLFDIFSRSIKKITTEFGITLMMRRKGGVGESSSIMHIMIGYNFCQSMEFLDVYLSEVSFYA